MDWKLRLKRFWCMAMAHPLEEEPGPPYYLPGVGMVVMYRCWCGDVSVVADAISGLHVQTMRRPK